jgi:hypothetical protein
MVDFLVFSLELLGILLTWVFIIGIFVGWFCWFVFFCSCLPVLTSIPAGNEYP